MTLPVNCQGSEIGETRAGESFGELFGSQILDEAVERTKMDTKTMEHPLYPP